MRSRRRLANRRGAETFDFEHAGHRFSLTVGRFSDGKPAEIFLSSSKPGSLIEAIARDAAVTVSIALQFGADLETIRGALTKDHDGGPATLLGAALDQRAASCRARFQQPCRSRLCRACCQPSWRGRRWGLRFWPFPWRCRGRPWGCGHSLQIHCASLMETNRRAFSGQQGCSSRRSHPPLALLCRALCTCPGQWQG